MDGSENSLKLFSAFMPSYAIMFAWFCGGKYCCPGIFGEAPNGDTPEGDAAKSSRLKFGWNWPLLPKPLFCHIFAVSHLIGEMSMSKIDAFAFVCGCTVLSVVAQR